MKELATAWVTGAHPAMRLIEQRLLQVANAPTAVLITGEIGVGKSRLTQLLHSVSPGAKRQLIPIYCSMLPDLLPEMTIYRHPGDATLNSELIKGARGATLQLKQIDMLSPQGQGRLLHFFERGEVVVPGQHKPLQLSMRLICSATTDLKTTCETGRFSWELFYRLSTIHFHLPPLRERLDDLAELADSLLASICRSRGPEKIPSLSPAALNKLRAHRWPGNLCELAAVLERALVLSPQRRSIPAEAIELITIDMPLPLASAQLQLPTEANDGEAELSLEDYFQRFVLEHQETMSETELARKLGISRKCLWERRQRLDLPRGRSANERLKDQP